MIKDKSKHTSRNIAIGIFGILILLLGTFFIIDYSHYAQDKSPYKTFIIPRLELSVFQITTISADKTDMVGEMLIHNPLPFNLRADSLEYKIFIGGIEVIKSTYAKSLVIKRWDTTWVRLPVTAYNDKLITVLKQAEDKGIDSIVYEVQANFGSNIIIHHQFNLDIKKLLPVFYIPEVKMDKIQYDSLSIKSVTLYLNTTIVNKNKIAFKFKNLAFKFALADHAWVAGAMNGVIDIPDTSITSLVLPLRISFKEIGESLLPLIKHGKNTPYKFEATLQLVSDNNAIKNSEVILKNTGAIMEIVHLVKDENKKAKEKAQQSGKPKPPKSKLKIEKKKAD